MHYVPLVVAEAAIPVIGLQNDFVAIGKRIGRKKRRNCAAVTMDTASHEKPCFLKIASESATPRFAGFQTD